MQLFHQLDQQDQKNCIHHAMHIVVEDMLEDGVELEAFSEEDKIAKTTLEKAVADAKKLPEEEQFEFLVNHEEAGTIIFDIALDLARATFYCVDSEQVVYYESLRQATEESEEILEELTEGQEVNVKPKKGSHSVN